MMEEVSFFFITGLPQTGKSLLASLIDEIPGVRVFGETRFFGGRLGDFNPLFDNLNKAVFDWLSFVGKRKGTLLSMEREIITINKTNFVKLKALEDKAKEISKLMIRSYFYHLVREKKINNNISIVGEHTPVLLTEELENWFYCFDDSLFIILVRDLVDWVVSIANAYYNSVSSCRPDRNSAIFSDEDFIDIYSYKSGKSKDILSYKTFQRLAEIYFDHLAFIEKEKRNFRLLILRFEDVISSPERTLAKVVKFLNIECRYKVHNKLPSVKKIKASDYFTYDVWSYLEVSKGLLSKLVG